MTFLEFMAGLALTVFWLHLAIMAAAAVADLRRAAGPYRAHRRAGFRRAEIVAGSGPAGALAEHRIEQRGRSKGDGKIHFHDREHHGEVFGGQLRLTDGEVKDVGPSGELWPDRALVLVAADEGRAEQFAEAYAAARKAKGWLRTVATPLRVGDTVWYAEAEGAVVLAQRDPSGWFSQRATLVALAVVLGLGIGGGLTVVALWPPLFGTVGKIGAFAMVVYFNLAQDAGRIINEFVRPPSRAYLRGVWRQP